MTRVWIMTALLLAAIPVRASAQDTIIWKSTGWGCQSWDTVKELINYVAKGDKDMWKLGFERYLSTGECTLLDPGDRIIIMERGFSSFRFRRDGKFDQYWVAKPAPV
jgi:hypothetical protein